MTKTQTIAMVAAMLGIEVPTYIGSKGIIYPSKASLPLKNGEQRIADARAKRERRAAKLRFHAAMDGIKAPGMVACMTCGKAHMADSGVQQCICGGEKFHAL